MHKVLITGITGFLGSNIAEVLIKNNIEVIGLKRITSDSWRCKEFTHQIDWVDIDEDGLWKAELENKKPDTIIHGAWIGVEASDRDNWTEQAKNVGLFVSLLEISKTVGLKKFIFLGSQAEYGNIDGKITEDYPVSAVNAYASIKLACLEICRSFCASNNINWIWLRLFSLFGEKESDKWLIPSMISKMLSGNSMDFTRGEQKYAYLYVKDFANIIYKILLKPVTSGIYNVSSNDIQQLCNLIERIKRAVNPDFKVNFGALPYRVNQSMHIEGDISKLAALIGPFSFTNFNDALENTITYYKSK